VNPAECAGRSAHGGPPALAIRVDTPHGRDYVLRDTVAF